MYCSGALVNCVMGGRFAQARVGCVVFAEVDSVGQGIASLFFAYVAASVGSARQPSPHLPRFTSVSHAPPGTV